MEKLYIDANNKLHIDPRYVGVVIEKLLQDKFGIDFDISVSSKFDTDNSDKTYNAKINVSDNTIAEIKVYCKNPEKVLMDFLKAYASMNKSGNEAGMQMVYNPELIFQTTNWDEVAEALGKEILKCVKDEEASGD